MTTWVHCFSILANSRFKLIFFSSLKAPKELHASDVLWGKLNLHASWVVKNSGAIITRLVLSVWSCVLSSWLVDAFLPRLVLDWSLLTQKEGCIPPQHLMHNTPWGVMGGYLRARGVGSVWREHALWFALVCTRFREKPCCQEERHVNLSKSAGDKFPPWT